MERLNRHDLDQKFVERRIKAVERIYGAERVSKKAGRYRKQHPMDCGNPRCMICHSTKILDQKTHKQAVEDLRFKQQLDD